MDADLRPTRQTSTLHFAILGEKVMGKNCCLD
jgi:hypothetical protein